MAARLAVLVLLVAAFPGCSALGLFDAMPATSCVRDEDCQVPGLVEDPCVRFTCNLTSRFCVGSLVDHDGDGQAPVGCASSLSSSVRSRPMSGTLNRPQASQV